METATFQSIPLKLLKLSSSLTLLEDDVRPFGDSDA